MSENKRPYEVGDMVIIPKYKTEGIITGITDTCISVDDGTEEGVGYNPKLIKTIRTPRKGSAEARAIVAMLKNQVRLLKRKCNLYRSKEDGLSKIIYMVATQEIAQARMLATEAKAMLK
jgi:hypothetical protein